MNIEIQGNIQVKGKVQGVWFRAFTKEKAEELGLTGWVQNYKFSLKSGGQRTHYFGVLNQVLICLG